MSPRPVRLRLTRAAAALAAAFALVRAAVLGPAAEQPIAI
jgi:hypothetical protein